MATTAHTTDSSTMTTPPPPPPPAGGNLRFVKVSEGQLKYKPSKDAEYEVLPEVTGTLKRVAVRTSDWNGQTFESAEAEVEDADGVKSIVEVSLQNSVGCGQFMAGLCLLKEGEYICIRAHASKDKNKFGKYTTFMDFKVYDTVQRMWRDIQTSPNAPGETWRDRLPGVQEEFEKLPFYKEREEGGGGSAEPGEFDLFVQTVAGKDGWKPVKGNEDAYLKWICSALGEEILTLDDVEEDFWTELRQHVGLAKKAPAALKA